MEYFLIKQHEGIKKYVNITFDFFDRKEIWKKQDPIFIPLENTEEMAYLPFLDCGVCVVSKEMKKIFEMYQKAILSRPVILADIKAGLSDVFYCIKTIKIDCLGSSTVYQNNVIQKIYLNDKKIGYEKVFQIKAIAQRHIVADLEVVEKLLRENIVGFDAVLLEKERGE